MIDQESAESAATAQPTRTTPKGSARTIGCVTSQTVPSIGRHQRNSSSRTSAGGEAHRRCARPRPGTTRVQRCLKPCRAMTLCCSPNSAISARVDKTAWPSGAPFGPRRSTVSREPRQSLPTKAISQRKVAKKIEIRNQGKAHGKGACHDVAPANRGAALTATVSLDRKALAAAAGALGVGVGEHEAGGEIVLDPVHRRCRPGRARAAVDVEACRRGSRSSRRTALPR